MKSSLHTDMTYTRSLLIDRERTIEFMGDELRVYATPFMVRDVELTCRELLLSHHDPGEETVGARVEIDHLGPTLAGQTVSITARVAELALPRARLRALSASIPESNPLSKSCRFIRR